MTFMELLERFVAAHEKQAEAAMLMAKSQYSTGGSTPPQPLGDSQEAGKPDGTEGTATEKKERKPRKPKDAPAEQAPVEEPKADTPAQDLPPVEPKPEAPAEPEITLEALKSAAGLYCARRKVAGSDAPAGDCAALLQAHAGVSKTAEVPADKRKACLDAFEANWMPQEEEL